MNQQKTTAAPPARRLTRTLLTALFGLALLCGGSALLAAPAEARTRSHPHKVKKQRRARAVSSAKRRPAPRRRRPAARAAAVERLYEPTDGGKGEGENVIGREQWFRLQRGYPAEPPADARRRAWQSRPKGKVKRLHEMDAARSSALGLEAQAVAAPRWRSLGPAPTTPRFEANWGVVSGRINAIAVKPDDPNVILVGASTGGIWRSADGGLTFAPVTDSQVDLSVAALAFAPSNPSVVYAGMGDKANNYFGTGVLKSTDGGATWARVSQVLGTDCQELPPAGQAGCLPARGIARKILVHPADPNRVYLVQISFLNLAGASEYGGLRYSADGGVTWATIFDGHARDAAFHPTNPQIVYVANTYHPASQHQPGIHRSTNGGQTWALSMYVSDFGYDPSDERKDMRIAVTPATPDKVYLLMGYRDSWVKLRYHTRAADPSLAWVYWEERPVDPGQVGYNCFFHAHPTIPDLIYIGTRDVWKSANSGGTWTNLTNNFHPDTDGGWSYGPGLSNTHPDQHAFAFAPGDPSTIYVGNDGGLSKTTDGGATFKSLNRTLGLTQFVGLAAHPSDPNFILAGSQDNGTQLRGPAGSGWTEFAGGDGGHPFINPLDPRAVLSSYVRGDITRWLVNPDGSKTQRPGTTGGGTFVPEGAASGRIAFYPPITGNGVDQTVYVGSTTLFVSRDFADTAGVDSPTWAAPAGNVDQTYYSDGTYLDVLSAIGVQRTAYSATQVIYTGSAMGRVMVSRDGGATWADVSAGLPRRGNGTSPRRSFVSSITVAPSDSTGATAFLTLGAYGHGHVWKTTDFGRTWVDLSGTDPSTKLPDVPASALLIDPSNPSVIYAGTDIGVFRSTADGGQWETFNDGMPPIIVTRFAVSANGNLLAATYGRGVYELTAEAGPATTLQFSETELRATEGGAAAVSVTRTGDTSGTHTVAYAASNGTATAGGDYTPASGTLSFAPGETAKTFNVTLPNDALSEADETVNLKLSSPTGGAALGVPSASVLTVADDGDPVPSVSIGDSSVVEGAEFMSFTVTLSAPSGQTVYVSWRNAPGTATGGPFGSTGGIDFFNQIDGVSFQPGETSKQLRVYIFNDTQVEPDEDLFVDLSGAHPATIADAQAVGVIKDNDGAVPTPTPTPIPTPAPTPAPTPSTGPAPALFNAALASNGATAAASSTLDAGRAAPAAINGDRRGLHWGSAPATGSGWHDATPNAFPDWIEVTFPRPQTLREVNVFSVQDNYANPAEPTEAMTFTQYGVTGFQVEYWDGAVWQPVPGAALAGNNKVWAKLSFAPVTASKLRVAVSAALAGHARITEVEAWAETPRANHALSSNGATAAATSTLDSTRLPIAAINGDRRGLHWGSDPSTGSGWTDKTGNAFPDRLEVTFPAARAVDEVSVFGLQDNFGAPADPTEQMASASYALTSFAVEYWTGSAWAVVPGGSVTGNNKVWRKLTFPAVTTTKLRLSVNAALGSYSRVVEFEAWGPAPGAAPAPTRLNVAASANGATATATSTLDSTRLPIAAINGDRKGLHWGSDPSTGSGWTDKTGNSFPDRLEVAFAGSKTITEVSVFGLQDAFQTPAEPTEAMASASYALQDFDVEYWTGSAWAVVPGGAITGNDKVWRKLTFPALTTARIRVSVKRALGGYSRVVEVEAY